jgi:hypothetical protein
VTSAVPTVGQRESGWTDTCMVKKSLGDSVAQGWRGALGGVCRLAWRQARVTAGRCHGKLPGSGSPSMWGEGPLAETFHSAGMAPGTALRSFSARSGERSEERNKTIGPGAS